MKLSELPPNQIKEYIRKNWDNLHKQNKLGKAYKIYFLATGSGEHVAGEEPGNYVAGNRGRGTGGEEEKTKIIGDSYAFAVKTFDGGVPTLFGGL